jgi:hypothetical protein
VTQSKKSHVGKRKSSELGPDNEIIPNPPTVKMQKQKRCQPSDSVGLLWQIAGCDQCFFPSTVERLYSHGVSAACVSDRLSCL